MSLYSLFEVLVYGLLIVWIIYYSLQFESYISKKYGILVTSLLLFLTLALRWHDGEETTKLIVMCIVGLVLLFYGTRNYMKYKKISKDEYNKMDSKNKNGFF